MPQIRIQVTIIGTAATFVLAGVIAYFAFSTWSSALLRGSDKLLHFLAFLGLAVPLSFARPKHAYRVALCVIFYGGFIEVIQSTIGRDASWADLFADAAGALVGAAIGGWLGHLPVTTRDGSVR